MKNIETILAEQNIELTDEQKKSINDSLLENYITKAEHDKKIDKANAETDKYKTQYEEASKTVDSFKDLEERYEKEKTELNTKVEETESKYKSILDARDRKDAISNAIEGIEFSSISAKKSIIAEIQSRNLPLEDGKLVGVSDVITSLKESDPNAFVDNTNKGKFTSKKKDTTPKGLTKEEILKIKNPTDRKIAIANNKELFSKE